MAKGSASLQTHIAKLRGLSNLVKDSTPEIVDAVKGVVAAQVARGETPDGRKWKLRILDGARALQKAAEEVDVSAVKNVILLTIRDHYARHNRGAVKGKTRRRILPSTKLPNPYVKAIRALLVRNFKGAMQ